MITLSFHDDKSDKNSVIIHCPITIIGPRTSPQQTV